MSKFNGNPSWAIGRGRAKIPYAVPSGGVLDLRAFDGKLVHVSTTATITSILAPPNGECIVVFDAACTLTHNSATLMLPGAANITTAANDVMFVVDEDGTAARVTNFSRASGKSIASPYTSLLVFTTTQTWTAPANVYLIELMLTNGGAAGNNAVPSDGASGAITGITLVSVIPGTVYTMTIGAAGVVPAGAGGASSMSGSGLTTVTTTNSTLKINGDPGGLLVGANNGIGGSSFLGTYGAGGNGNAGGNAGVAIIRF